MSMSLPNPSQLRRPKTILSPDGTTAKFLYTIIKQLDLKAIDWNEVASHLDITNGHAARMRYSRFKTQIEGTLKEQKPKSKGSDNKDTKSKTVEKKRGRVEEVVTRNEPDMSIGTSMYVQADEYPTKRVKAEDGQSMPVPGIVVKSETVGSTTRSLSDTIKIEPGTRIHYPTVTTYTVPFLNSPPAKSRTITEQNLADNNRTNVTPQSSQPSKNVIKSECHQVPHTASQQGKHRNKSAMQPRMQYQPYQFGSHSYHPQQYYPQPTYQTMNTYAYPSPLGPNMSASYYHSPYVYHQQQTRQPYQLQQQLSQQHSQIPRSTQVNPSLQNDATANQTLNTSSNNRDLTTAAAATAASYPWPYSESMISNPIKPIDTSMTAITTYPNTTTSLNNAANLVPEVATFNPDMDFDVFGPGLAGDLSEWVMGGDLVPPVLDVVAKGNLDSSSNPVETVEVGTIDATPSADLVNRDVNNVDTTAVPVPSGTSSSRENHDSLRIPVTSTVINDETEGILASINTNTDTNQNVSDSADTTSPVPSAMSISILSDPAIDSVPTLQTREPSTNTTAQTSKTIDVFSSVILSATPIAAVPAPASTSLPGHQVSSSTMTTNSSSSYPSNHGNTSSTSVPLNVPQYTVSDSIIMRNEAQNEDTTSSSMSSLPAAMLQNQSQSQRQTPQETETKGIEMTNPKRASEVHDRNNNGNGSTVSIDQSGGYGQMNDTVNENEDEIVNGDGSGSRNRIGKISMGSEVKTED